MKGTLLVINTAWTDIFFYNIDPLMILEAGGVDLSITTLPFEKCLALLILIVLFSSNGIKSTVSGEPSRIPPAIDSVDVGGITFNSTKIYWTTDILSDSRVTISSNPDLTEAKIYMDSEMVTSHSIHIWDLEPSTTYHFSVSSTDGGGNTSIEDNDGNYYNFTTSPSYGPSITSMISKAPTTGDKFNMTVTASDDWGVSDVWAVLSIDGGEQQRVNFSWAGMIWYANIEIPSHALKMNYTIFCRDIEGNMASTGLIESNITDNDPPKIQLMDHEKPTTGDSFTVSAIITDNIGVDSANLMLWYDTGTDMTNILMERTYNDSWTASANITDDPNRELRFKITAYDTSNNLASTETRTPSIEDNDPPFADAGEDIFIENGNTATFDGSGSTDNDAILNYTWTLIYGNESVYLYSMMENFTFHDPGIYNVTLKVEDHSSLTSRDHVLVHVQDTIPPVPVVTGNLSVAAGKMLVLSAENSTDNDAITEYRWSFFDEENINIDGPILSHLFQNRGFFDITLTVVDRWNLSASKTVRVEIVDSVDPVPVIEGDIVAALGKEVIFDGSLSTDDGEIKVYYWNFNDGDEEVELFGEIVGHTFNSTGSYDVSFTVFDQSGNFASRVFTVNVVDSGIIKGKVTDPDGKPVSGVPVKAKGPKGDTYFTETRDDGNFSLEVPRGRIKWTIGGSEHEKISGEADIEAMEEITLDLSDRPLRPKEGFNILFVIIGAIIAVIISAILVLVVYMRIKNIDDGDDTGEGSSIGSMPYPVAKTSGQVPVHREIEVKGEIPMFTRGEEDEEPEQKKDSLVGDLFEE